MGVKASTYKFEEVTEGTVQSMTVNEWMKEGIKNRSLECYAKYKKKRLILT